MSPERNRLSTWEMLAEEYAYFAGGEIPQDFSVLLAEFKKKCVEFEKETTENGYAAKVDAAERALAANICSKMHTGQFSALCLSGGGIRSATFALGVLQGLARHSCIGPGTDELTLLGEIHYLSTVSGGGYIGSWITSWVKRSCLRHVISELSRIPESKLNPEPEPVRHLRDFSNYLTPKLGLGSADTWTLAATVLRNILLNWLVLLPMLASLLMIPRILLAAVHSIAGNSELQMLQQHELFSTYISLAVTALFALIVVIYAIMSIPAVGINNKPQTSFLLWCAGPLMASAALFSVAVVMKSRLEGPMWPEKDYLTGAPALLLAAIACSAVYARSLKRKLTWEWGLGALALGIAGFFGGWVVYLLSRVIGNGDTRSVLHERWFVVLSVPVILSTIFVSATLLVGFISKVTEDEDREWLARATGWVLLLAVTWLVAATLGVFGPAGWELESSAVAAAIGGVLARLGYSSGTSSGRKGTISISALKGPPKKRAIAIVVLLPVFVLTSMLALSSINERLIEVMPDWWKFFPATIQAQNVHGQAGFRQHLQMAPGALKTETSLFGIELLICILATLFVNVNKFSLHGMYRARLIRAYLGASREKAARNPNLFTGFDPEDNLFLGALRQKPFHVVNMTLNLVAGKQLAWQQRKAASFTASPLHVGSLWWGYRPAAQYSDKKNGFSLGGAITISGAAASPNMGYHSSPLLTVVMTLFNARLGAWLGNPGKSGDRTWFKDGPFSGLRSFVDEMFGLTDEENKWVYLSDGGHFENLGLYEMVLRRCRYIIVVDASCDEDYSFGDFANAVRKIRVDMGIPIIVPGLSTIGTGTACRHFAVGDIFYSKVDGNDPREDGHLLYIKPSLSGSEPADVTHYHKEHNDFPHETTADQWFSESQFESYRALGLYIMESIIGDGCITVAELFEKAKGARQEHRAIVK